MAIPAGESHPALKVYSYTASEGNAPVYVGVGTDEGETVYYAVTKTETAEGGAAYTVGDKLTLGGTKWVTAAPDESDTKEYDVPVGFNGEIDTMKFSGSSYRAHGSIDHKRGYARSRTPHLYRL